MNEEYTDKLKVLRQRIPIGLRHGISLLEKVNGDLEKAEKLFQDEMMSLAVNKTGVTPEVAISHLIKNRFDINLTIKSIDEERYTLTELIFRRHKDKKEGALDEIMNVVEEKYNLKRDFWLDFDYLKTLPSEIYCFMTIMEWLNYEGWEDYGHALSFNLSTVTEQIENKLKLTGLADSLRQANNIQTLVYSKNQISKDFQNYINATDELREHKEYQKCEDEFKKQRPILIERLYELVKNNIDKYL
jgi:hypothetical protein